MKAMILILLMSGAANATYNPEKDLYNSDKSINLELLCDLVKSDNLSYERGQYLLAKQNKREKTLDIQIDEVCEFSYEPGDHDNEPNFMN